MARMYGFGKHATVNSEPSLTEQEHVASCDINKMVRDAARGIPVRGSVRDPVYGFDDLTLDAVTHRIQKEQVEKELDALKDKLSDEELNLIPESIRKKFNMVAKKVKDVVSNVEKKGKRDVSEEEVDEARVGQRVSGKAKGVSKRVLRDKFATSEEVGEEPGE